MRRYLAPVADGARWEGFEHREGDIVISTPPKCGTTWMQMLVALLVFDGPDFPAPLNEMSPWLDAEFTALTTVRDRLAGQEHRRFIKTHLPLDGLPIDERVTYLVVGRDPRDVFLSGRGHGDNINHERMGQLVRAGVGEEEWGRRLAAAPRYVTFAEALELAPGTQHTGWHPARVLAHLWEAWQRRSDAHVTLVHYRDLSADLGCELARLASTLGYDYSPEHIAGLARQAGLAEMRRRAGDLAPEAQSVGWSSDADFFRAGRLDAWAEAFSRDELLRYQERMTALFPDEELLAWAHGGAQPGEWRVAADG